MSNFLNLLVAGIISGSVYAIFAACISVWFRVSNVLNLAIGDFTMLGGIGVAELVQNEHVSLGLAILALVVAVGLIAWLFDWMVLHLALDRAGHSGIVTVFFYTFALSSLLDGLAERLFGTDVHAAPALWSGSVVSIGSVHIERAGILVVGLALAVGALLGGYLSFTVSGKAAAACGESVIGSKIVGIDSQKLRRRILVVTAVVAALFGIVESPMIGFVYNTGPTISLLGVVAAGFAGFRRPWRALAAGLAIGIVEAMLGGYVSTEYNDVVLYGMIIAVVVLRPELLGLGDVAS